MPTWSYYAFAAVLTVLNFFGVALNLLSIPGNWLIVVLTALFAFLVHSSAVDGISWWVVGTLVVLAAVGELTETLTTSASAARRGASRRGMLGALVGSLAGSILGAIIGLPVPIAGSAIAAMAGGALGAFGGAVLAETSLGRHSGESISVGWAAFWGKIFGTIGKVIIGIVMFVVATFDAFF